MTTHYTYDSCGRLLEETLQNLTITYSYDERGNRQTKSVTTAEGTISYTYTPLNKVATLVTPDGTKTSYGYDTKGIRTKKEVEGTKHVYYYAFGEFIGEEVEGKKITYVYGTSILGQIQEGVGYNYFTNGQGDVVYLQDKENKLYDYYAYDAFGNRIEVIETLYNPRTYRGYYYDEESGDYYLRARYYNASIGRFISEDSDRGKYEDPLSLNLYTYGHNSPLYYSDPSGHWAILVSLVGNLLEYGKGTAQGDKGPPITVTWPTSTAKPTTSVKSIPAQTQTYVPTYIPSVSAYDLARQMQVFPNWYNQSPVVLGPTIQDEQKLKVQDSQQQRLNQAKAGYIKHQQILKGK